MIRDTFFTIRVLIIVLLNENDKASSKINQTRKEKNNT